MPASRDAFVARSLKAFRLVDDSRKGAVEVDIDGKGGAGAAARTCAAINDEAAKRGTFHLPQRVEY